MADLVLDDRQLDLIEAIDKALEEDLADPLAPPPSPPSRVANTLVAIGPTGSVRCYLNVPVEEAAARYFAATNDGNADIYTFTFEDTFDAYYVEPTEGSTPYYGSVSDHLSPVDIAQHEANEAAYAASISRATPSKVTVPDFDLD